MSHEPTASVDGTPLSLHCALVVEDALTLGTLFQNVLRTHFDCRTTLVGSVAEAIAFLEREHVDFVVSDLMMTGGSGLDLAAWLRAHRPTLAERLLIITACAGDTELGQALAREEVRVLYKPFNATALVRAIERTYQAGA